MALAPKYVYIQTYLQNTSNPSCALVEPYAAVLIGLGSAPLNNFVSRALKRNVSRLNAMRQRIWVAQGPVRVQRFVIRIYRLVRA